jgi:hypothetical protein
MIVMVKVKKSKNFKDLRSSDISEVDTDEEEYSSQKIDDEEVEKYYGERK